MPSFASRAVRAFELGITGDVDLFPDLPAPEKDGDDPEGGGVAEVAGADFGDEIGGEAGRGGNRWVLLSLPWR
jgi:hypothetical protein